MTVTVDAFLENVKRRITVPSNQVLLTDDKMLDMTYEVMRERLVPLILSVNQNYYVTETYQQAIAEQASYTIPYRAIGRGLRDIKLRNGTDNNTTQNLALIALEDIHMYSDIGTPAGICFIGDSYRVIPRPVSSMWQFVIWYDRQPSKPVKANSAGRITAISGSSVTVASLPSSFIAGATVDFIDKRSACSLKGMDAEITSAGGTTISFASASVVPASLVVGDYVALSEQTPVMQMPDECSPMLELWTAERILYAIGDFEGAQVLKTSAEQVETNLKMILSPRIEGEQTKIINRNGLLRRNVGVWRLRGGFYG